MLESSRINRSLLTLSTIVHRLAEGSHSHHLPYRDSKLTRLLQPCLGGRSALSLTACEEVEVVLTNPTECTTPFSLTHVAPPSQWRSEFLFFRNSLAMVRLTVVFPPLLPPHGEIDLHLTPPYTPCSSRAVLISTVSPGTSHVEESLVTLRFASRARRIHSTSEVHSGARLNLCNIRLKPLV